MDHPTRRLDRPEENDDPPDQETRRFDQPLPASQPGTPTRRLGPMPPLPAETETPHSTGQFVDHRPLDQRGPTPTPTTRQRTAQSGTSRNPHPRPALPAALATNRKCLRCGQMMIRADVGGLRLIEHGGESLWRGPKGSAVEAAVCPDCGYTEFSATTPQNLLPTDPWIR